MDTIRESTPTSQANFRSLVNWLTPTGRSRHNSGGSPGAEDGATGVAPLGTSPPRLVVATAGLTPEASDSWGSAYAKCYARRQEKCRRNELVMAGIQGKIPKLEQMSKAIQSGNVEMVKEVTRKGGVDVNACFESGSNPLASAVVCSQKEIVKWLVSQGADCNKKDGTGTTPLHLSVQWNWVSDSVIIDYLLEGHANPNVLNDAGETPLHSAIKRHRKQHVLKFLSRGASPNKGVVQTGKTPVMLASESGQIDILVALTETYKADLQLRDRAGNTILHHAVQAGHIPVVEYLLGNNCHPNVTNSERLTPIKIAVSKGHTKIVSMLLSAGAGISLQHRELLLDAAKNRRPEILQLLFIHGATATSELVFQMLNECLLTQVNSESWVPVFRVLLQGTGCLHITDTNDDLLHRAALKASELRSAANLPGSQPNRGLQPLSRILLLFALSGYNFTARTLNATRVEGDPFDAGRGQPAPPIRASQEPSSSSPVTLTFPFPSLHRSLVHLFFERPRSLRELAALAIRHCACHSRTNVFHASRQLPLPKVLQCSIIDVCDSLTLDIF